MASDSSSNLSLTTMTGLLEQAEVLVNRLVALAKAQKEYNEAVGRIERDVATIKTILERMMSSSAPNARPPPKQEERDTQLGNNKPLDTSSHHCPATADTTTTTTTASSHHHHRPANSAEFAPPPGSSPPVSASPTTTPTTPPGQAAPLFPYPFYYTVTPTSVLPTPSADFTDLIFPPRPTTTTTLDLLSAGGSDQQHHHHHPRRFFSSHYPAETLPLVSRHLALLPPGIYRVAISATTPSSPCCPPPTTIRSLTLSIYLGRRPNPLPSSDTDNTDTDTDIPSSPPTHRRGPFSLFSASTTELLFPSSSSPQHQKKQHHLIYTISPTGIMSRSAQVGRQAWDFDGARCVVGIWIPRVYVGGRDGDREKVLRLWEGSMRRQRPRWLVGREGVWLFRLVAVVDSLGGLNEVVYLAFPGVRTGGKGGEKGGEKGGGVEGMVLGAGEGEEGAGGRSRAAAGVSGMDWRRLRPWWDWVVVAGMAVLFVAVWAEIFRMWAAARRGGSSSPDNEYYFFPHVRDMAAAMWAWIGSIWAARKGSQED